MKSLLVLAMGLLSSAAVVAQPKATVPEIKPGLWEVVSKMEIAPPDMSKMSAEEKSKYEAGKAERQERLKRMQQPRPMCITGEMVSKGHWFGGGRRAQDCEFSSVKTTAKQITYDVACTGERATAGKGKLTMVSATKFSGDTISKPSNPDPKAEPGRGPREVKITSSGEWKAADCGATTPNYPNIKK